MAEMPAIDTERCNGCGLCVCVCLRNVLVLVEKIITVIETGECGWCTYCELVCPTGAISCPYEIVVVEEG